MLNLPLLTARMLNLTFLTGQMLKSGQADAEIIVMR
jgi:hypothetical protein